MPLARVRRGSPNREKPSELVRGIDSRLPWAWDGLCFGVPFHEASNDGLRDVVNNAAPSYIQDFYWTQDKRGNPVGAFVQTNGERVEWADHPRHDQPSSALTVYVRFRCRATPDLDGGVLANVYTTGDPWTTWAILASPVDETKLQANLTLGTTDTTIGDTASLPSNEYVSVFLRWADGLAPRFDVLGERGNTLSTLTHGSTLSGSLGYNAGWGIRLNASEAVNNNHYAYYSQAMVWSRRLSDTELACLTADPFGWYSPRSETVGLSGPYALPFGGGEMRIASMGGGMM